jgi:hypothetical protein
MTENHREEHDLQSIRHTVIYAQGKQSAYKILHDSYKII